MRLEVWDSPNSAGVVIDAIRCAKLALDRGLSGALVGPSSYFMKTPPRQFTDDEARNLTEAFIRGDKVAAANSDRRRNKRSNLRRRSIVAAAANGFVRNGSRAKRAKAK
jgi:hypothetical protein